VIVSTGFPGFSTVPESRGAPIQDAITIMERAGYATEIVLAETATVTPGLVIQQSVPAGTVAPMGSVVLLTVATPPILAPQPEVPQPEVPQPEVPQPEVPQPEVPQPEVPQPEVPQPAPDPAAPPVEDPAAPAPAP